MMNNLLTRGAKAAVLILAAGLLAGCDRENDHVNAFIDIDTVLQRSGLLAQEQAHLQQVQSRLQEGAELAEQHYAKLPDDKARAARESDAQVLNMQWQTEQAAARRVTLAVVQEKAAVLLRQEKLRAILPVQSAVAVAPEADVSGALAASLTEEKLSFGALPDVQVSAPPAADAPEKKAKPAPKK